jgi:protein-L-isoaspartate(D-aspartate) O-methyltransferase
MDRRILFLLLIIFVVAIPGCAGSIDEPSTGTEIPSDILESAQTRTPADELSDPYFEARQVMVRTGIVAYGVNDPTVVEAMGIVPRHEFVPEDYLHLAYRNHPLPIGYGQTISQPFMVAFMTQELSVEAGDRVLEIGTGSGYQAAVLSELGIEVFTIEIIGPLAEAAEDRLERLGFEGVHIMHADGYFGWPDEALFDAIIVTAAPDHVPQPLVDQLKVGGVMVIPVGPVGAQQVLWRITRVDEDNVEAEQLILVQFVPFTREVREE